MIDKTKNMKNKLMKTELEEARDAYNASQNKNSVSLAVQLPMH